MTYQFPPMDIFEKGIAEIAEEYTREFNMIKEKHLECEIIWEMS